MNFPNEIKINKDWSYGSIYLGNKVVCDGKPTSESIVNVFTHAHEDHVKNDLITEAYQKDKRVIMSEITRQLCSTFMLVNLEYDFNLKVIDDNEEQFEGFTIKLVESKHILGSSQVEINDEVHGKIGYSGDFGEKVNEYIDVDLLVLDGTYSGDFNNRKWTMDEAMEQLVDDIKENIGRRDINLIADAGLLQNILSELDIWEDIPNVIGTKKEKGWCEVYENALFSQPKNVFLKGSEEERQLKFEKNPILTIGHSRSILGDIPKGLTYIVKNIGIENEEPINQINENLKRVGISSHSTGRSVIEYVEKVNPEYVLTDSTRSQSNAKKLAKNIGQELGIPSISSEELLKQKVG